MEPAGSRVDKSLSDPYPEPDDSSPQRSYRNYFRSTGQEASVHVHCNIILSLKHVKLTESLNTIKLTSRKIYHVTPS
jgi:hypothetical protein